MEPEVSLLYLRETVTDSYSEPDESNLPSEPTCISLRSVLILSSRLCLGLPSGLFPSDFPTKILCSLLPHTCYIPHSSHPPWFDHPNNIWWSVQILKLLTVQCSPASRHFLPVRSSAPCSQTSSVYARRHSYVSQNIHPYRYIKLTLTNTIPCSVGCSRI
jgi:hypothetical protein